MRLTASAICGTDLHFVSGTMAGMKNLAILAGNCNHRRYIPELLAMVASGVVQPDQVLTNREGMTSAIDAYESFDARRTGWTKVELDPATA